MEDNFQAALGQPKKSWQLWNVEFFGNRSHQRPNEENHQWIAKARREVRGFKGFAT